MKKKSLSLLAAGVMAVAGMAHADAIFYPDGTMVELGDMGAESLALDTSIDTTVLGAGPAVSTMTTVTTTPTVEYVYVQPNINFDRAAAVTHLHSQRMMHNDRQRTQAAATFNVPARAGEASTMTGGVPNMLTSNDHMMVGSTWVPYSSVTVGQPYYVMSW